MLVDDADVDSSNQDILLVEEDVDEDDDVEIDIQRLTMCVTVKSL